MALIDEVTAYYTTAELVRWTNPSTRAASSIDTTRLQEACDDTEAWFAVYAGVEYDNSNRKHLVLARDGALLQLKKAAGKQNESIRNELRAWEDSVKEFAKTDARNRVLPATDNYRDAPTDDTETRRPRFDRRKFKGVRPR